MLYLDETWSHQDTHRAYTVFARSLQPKRPARQIEPLLATLEASNQALVQAQREAGLRIVEKRIEEAQGALTQVSANAELSNAALHPLQQLKLKIADAVSIPQIQFHANSSGDKLEEAMDLIRESMLKAHASALGTSKTGTTSAASKASPGATSNSVAEAPKAAQTIRPAELAASSYLETEAEVDAYLADLKTHFTAVLKSGKRIRIQ